MKTAESRKISINHSDTLCSDVGNKREHRQNEVPHCKTINSVQTAAIWLAANPDKVVDPRIPFVRQKFELSITQAVEALKLAHAIQFGRAM